MRRYAASCSCLLQFVNLPRPLAPPALDVPPSRPSLDRARPLYGDLALAVTVGAVGHVLPASIARALAAAGAVAVGAFHDITATTRMAEIARHATEIQNCNNLVIRSDASRCRSNAASASARRDCSHI